jgi:hypothetical protein
MALSRLVMSLDRYQRLKKGWQEDESAGWFTAHPSPSAKSSVGGKFLGAE